MEVTQTRVTKQNGCHPALPILETEMQDLRFNIMGRVHVGRNIGTKKERNGW